MTLGATLLAILLASLVQTVHMHSPVHLHPNVLPPEPDEEWIICQNRNHSLSPSTNYSSCGIERFCSPFHDINHPSSNSTSVILFCLHKAFYPIQILDVVALVITFLCCLVAAMAGIGGGGLVFPTVVMVLNFTPKEAAVISNAAVFGNGLAQSILNNQQQRRRRYLPSGVVSNTILMMLPGLLAGGSATLALERVVPQTLILILALLTLVLASIKTYIKARQLWNDTSGTIATTDEEVHLFSLEGEEQVQESVQTQEEPSPTTSWFIGARGVNSLILTCWCLNAITFLAIRETKFSSCSLGYFSLTFMPLGFCVFFAWRGRVILCNNNRNHGNNSSMYTDDNDDNDGGTLQQPLLISTIHSSENPTNDDSTTVEPTINVYRPPSTTNARSIKNDHGNELYTSTVNNSDLTVQQQVPMSEAATTDGRTNMETRNNIYGSGEGVLETVEEETPLLSQTYETASPSFDVLVWWLPPVSILIGSLSALLGIGGGELVGPLLLFWNMEPKYSSITTATMSLLNSSTNMLFYAITGRVFSSPNYKLAFFISGFFGGACGRGLALLRGSKGIVAFCLTGVLVVAAVLVFYELVTTPAAWSVEGLCE